MSSIRENILSALATRLSASREPARADMANSIFLEDQGETATLLDYETVQAEMTVRLESLSSTITAESRPTAENRLLASLISTATGSDRTLSSLCDDIVYTGGGPIFTDDPTVYAGAYATFTVQYRFNTGNPNTLTHY